MQRRGLKLLRQLVQRVSGQTGGAAAQGPPAHVTAVLFVCSGNICRSPMAEGVLRAKLRAAGLQDLVHVDSAGTHGYHTAEPPDPRAVRAAAACGYDIGRLRARPVGAHDFLVFHWMLALDDGHLRWLQRQAPRGHAVRIDRVMDHATRHPGVTEVPDPYYGSEAGFVQVLAWVEDACDGVVAALRARTPPRA
jgi:protein-tyrosine phosphatase